MSTTKTRRSLSLLAAFAVAAGALALPAATSATQAAPAFGLAATVTRAPRSSTSTHQDRLHHHPQVREGRQQRHHGR